MRKQYIAPTSRVHQLTCKTVLLADSYQLQVSNDETTEQLVKEQNGGSGTSIWDNEW